MGQNKGLDMADHRLVNSKDDTVQTDLLIGADYYDDIVSPHHMPKQVLGMWLRRIIYGQYILQGKIPGSSVSVKDNIKALNITIHHVANCPFLPILDNDETVDIHNAKEFNHYDTLGIGNKNNNDISSTCETPKTPMICKRKSFNKNECNPKNFNFQLNILKIFFFNFLIC